MSYDVMKLLILAILSRADEQDRAAMIRALREMIPAPDPASDSFENKQRAKFIEDIEKAALFVMGAKA